MSITGVLFWNITALLIQYLLHIFNILVFAPWWKPYEKFSIISQIKRQKFKNGFNYKALLI